MRKISAFMIAGTHSGCGKTMVTLAMIASLVRRGYRVQPFKVGPDFIDPGHHRRISGRDSHNLDGWMIGLEYSKKIFYKYTADADVAVVEGVMGLYDGYSGSDESGSSSQMAKALGIPVLLVVDARSMARSAAALTLGYRSFDPALHFGGVIFNMVGSNTHAEHLREAIAHSLSGVSVLGCLKRNESITTPSRHLGLITDEDNPFTQERIDALIDWIEDGLDLKMILEKTSIQIDSGSVYRHSFSTLYEGDRIPIGLARDQAFCFYYAENLRLLEEAGAQLVEFSPIKDHSLPKGLRGIILGGGYPELYAEQLARNRSLMEQIREFSSKGGPIYAECGGFMYLGKSIRDLQNVEHPMVGIFPVKSVMNRSLKSLGYREVITLSESPLGPKGTTARGHEFHYSHLDGSLQDPVLIHIYNVDNRKRAEGKEEGFMKRNTLGSYIHLHWGSNPEIPQNFVRFCREADIET